MAILSIPNQQVQLTDPQKIRSFMNERGIFFDQWFCDVVFDDDASTEEILAAYASDLNPFMKKGGYQTADVISIHSLKKPHILRSQFFSFSKFQSLLLV